MSKEDMLVKAQEYVADDTYSKINEEVLDRLDEFVKLYPFRTKPGRIDSLTPDDIYRKGEPDCFSTWIERKLKALAHLGLRSNSVWENARDNIEVFKSLMKIAVNDSLILSNKVDANWGAIKQFGSDKQVAKKIICCYYPDDFLSMLKTEDLEHFVKLLDIDYKKTAISKFNKEYSDLSKGKKYQLLNTLVLTYKNENAPFKKWNNLYFTRFLYAKYPPQH